MMEGDNHINDYSGHDIRRYLEGKLSAEEMHRMEKRALTDPFLADAIAGMELHAKQPGGFSYEKDLADLNARLRRRIGGGATVRGIWWRVAAVLVLVIGTVAITFFFTDRKMQRPVIVAKAESERIKPAPRPTLPDTVVAKEGVVASTSDVVPPPRRRVGKRPADAAVLPGKELKKSTRVPPAEQSREDEVTGHPALLSPAESLGPVASRKGVDTLSEQLEGRVAGIDIDRSRRGADEVAATGYGLSKRLVRPVLSIDTADMRNFIPDGGWPKFEEYVRKHKMDSVEDESLHGKETVTFSINDSGRPEHIVIAHSVSPAHDAAIARLLLAGPDWTTKGSKRHTLRMSVTY